MRSSFNILSQRRKLLSSHIPRISIYIYPVKPETKYFVPVKFLDRSNLLTIIYNKQSYIIMYHVLELYLDEVTSFVNEDS